jgi:hypothetical protein
MNSQEEKNTLLEEAHVGVNAVEIILQLYKNISYFFAEDVLEKSLNPWDLKKICE